ncbi:bifunctional phosphopantothenoylcysteine decarboxylase/phosphopantothenate--cysteine ligase CoaBC [uncultured Methanoregula sp.]|uniref:bifunctional phosphopantothenoylcysteine decarboxylase/phosphopantothenate--cysteine ligase CoaBC n=1 Tax=uncultured Methanoregula sp. TaxID=1005933 RepID=UPI002AAC0B44|nr:bifunctional phosphopantothenoylcysteine decarboxylase/phosphopantothenate--cysteine ligase CoaBC [uncultured Methanoregula sp.]
MTPLQTLAGKEIVVAVTGSIAAVETIKLIHALRRRGAAVQTVMSAAAEGIISPDALTYASGRDAITRISGRVEHVTFCGDGGSADLLLIAPCTANTLSKTACGIDDTPVTTFATTALGSGKPVLIVPAMHHSMYRHPALLENIRKLRSWGVGIVEPRIEEGKAKIADTEEIVLRCERMILGKILAGRSVLITSGACREPVDDVRVLTTRSSGQMGRALALQAFRLGADVTVVHRDTFPCVNNLSTESAADMRAAVLLHLAENDGTDIYISAAAISDFAPLKQDRKIPSGKPSMIRLDPLPKLLDEVLLKYSPLVVAFKLGREPEKKAKEMIEKGVSLVLMNPPETMGSTSGDYIQMSAQGSLPCKGTKEEIAAVIWETLIREHLRSG